MPLTAEQLEELRRLPVPAGGNRVGLALSMLGMTQSQAGAALGESQPYISDIVRSRYNTITLAKAQKLAAHFGCTVEDIFPARDEVA